MCVYTHLLVNLILSQGRYKYSLTFGQCYSLAFIGKKDISILKQSIWLPIVKCP